MKSNIYFLQSVPFLYVMSSFSTMFLLKERVCIYCSSGIFLQIILLCIMVCYRKQLGHGNAKTYCGGKSKFISDNATTANQLLNRAHPTRSSSIQTNILQLKNTHSLSVPVRTVVQRLKSNNELAESFKIMLKSYLKLSFWLILHILK